MEEEKQYLLKMVLRTGTVIALYIEPSALDELICHPKFIKMKDDSNDIFVSIEDITAFEVKDNRIEDPKETDVQDQISENPHTNS